MPIYNKITVNDEVIIDLTQDTITKEKVPSGLIFHDKSGAVQTGTMPAQGPTVIVPSTSLQTAVEGGVYTTSPVTVMPIPSNYEEVTGETNTQTEILERLSTAVRALEIELEGKASGDGVEHFPYSITLYINDNIQTAYQVFYSCDTMEAIIYFTNIFGFAGNITSITGCQVDENRSTCNGTADGYVQNYIVLYNFSDDAIIKLNFEYPGQ